MITFNLILSICFLFSIISPSLAQTQDEQDILNRVNNLRIQNGLPALVWNNKLYQAAKRHSKDMMDHDFAGHTGSDDSNPEKRIHDAGYQHRNRGGEVGENVAWGSKGTTNQQIVDMWWNSPPHKANIINGKYEEAAVAIVVGEFMWKNKTYKDARTITMTFGSLAPTMRDVKINQINTSKWRIDGTVSDNIDAPNQIVVTAEKIQNIKDSPAVTGPDEQGKFVVTVETSDDTAKLLIKAKDRPQNEIRLEITLLTSNVNSFVAPSGQKVIWNPLTGIFAFDIALTNMDSEPLFCRQSKRSSATFILLLLRLLQSV